MNKVTIQEAREAKAILLHSLAAVEPEASVGIGVGEEGDLCLKVNLPHPFPAQGSIPAAVNGVPVRVEVVDRVRKQ